VRVFVAGGSGVVGIRLVPELVARGHVVAAMTRTPSKSELLAGLGAEPVVCDVFDRESLVGAVTAFRPDAVMHQLTDLPDDVDEVAGRLEGNARIREVGTANLVDAFQQSDASRFVAQSIAWLIDGSRPASVERLEELTLGVGGVVLRYGQFYGPGTYHAEPPPPPRIHVDRVARPTADALALDSGVYEVTDDGIG